MRSIHFDPDAWEDFLCWLGAARKMSKKITRLIDEIQRDPFTGIGKPEPLKGDLSGYWSRRIDDEHRLVYRADDKEVKILRLVTTTATDCRNSAHRPLTGILLFLRSPASRLRERSADEKTPCHLISVGQMMVARAMVWLSSSKLNRAPLVVAPSPVVGSFSAVMVM